MNEENDTPSEQDFDVRLRRALDKNGTGGLGGKDSTDLDGKGVAFRIGTELVVAVFVGGAIGYLLDTLLDTKPWFLIVFLLLGNAAGLWNIFRFTNKQGHTAGFRKSKRQSRNRNE